jgi:hypothetical protein
MSRFSAASAGLRGAFQSITTPSGKWSDQFMPKVYTVSWNLSSQTPNYALRHIFRYNS